MLGIEFLSHYRLLIDTVNQTLARKSPAVKENLTVAAVKQNSIKEAAFKSPKANATPHQTIHMISDAELPTNIKYIKGSDNIVADCLSKAEVNAIFSEITNIDFAQIANAQKDSDTPIESTATSSLKIVKRTLPGDQGVELLGDISTERFRPWIPEPFRRIVFACLQSLSHGGIKATRRLISEQFVWPNMTTDIKVWCQTCLACQETKVNRHTVAPLMQCT